MHIAEDNNIVTYTRQQIWEDCIWQKKSGSTRQDRKDSNVYTSLSLKMIRQNAYLKYYIIYVLHKMHEIGHSEMWHRTRPGLCKIFELTEFYRMVHDEFFGRNIKAENSFSSCAFFTALFWSTFLRSLFMVHTKMWFPSYPTAYYLYSVKFALWFRAFYCCKLIMSKVRVCKAVGRRNQFRVSTKL